MKIVKLIVKIVMGFLLITALIGWILPRDTSLEREIQIEAPAEKIYAIVNDMRQTTAWSPWYRIDPDNTTYSFEGDIGIGASMEWDSPHPKVKSGSQKIIGNEINKMVKTELYFADMDGPSYASFFIEEKDGVSNVKWNYEADLGSNPYFHYFGLMMDSMLGPSYEEGLVNLKNMVENLPDPEPIEEPVIDTDSVATEM
ncbi:MAG: SRPBCC family protein [Reichenbachiella sp.]